MHRHLESDNCPDHRSDDQQKDKSDPAMCNGVPKPACVHEGSRRFSQDPDPRRGSPGWPLVPPEAPDRVATGVDRLFSGTFG